MWAEASLYLCLACSRPRLRLLMPGLGPPIGIYNTNWDYSSLVPALPLAAWLELQWTPSLAAACVGCLELWESLYHEPVVAATFVIFADIWKGCRKSLGIRDLHGVCGLLSEFAAETNKDNCEVATGRGWAGWVSWVGQGLSVNSVSQINREHRVGTFMHWAGCGKSTQKRNHDICQRSCPWRELSCPLSLQPST